MADSVNVRRADLRSLSWGIAVVVLGMAMMATALAIKVFADHDRCEAGNELREDMRTAFSEYSAGLGEELGADPERVGRFTARTDAQLAELFPPRDCPLLG